MHGPVQTVEAREDYHNRSMGAIKAGGHFIQTSFPNVAQLPKYAYSVLGSSNTTYTNYTVRQFLSQLSYLGGLLAVSTQML